MNKAITNIKYNHLNQATEIDFGTKNTKYIYTATGVKLQTKIYEEGKLKSKTDYSGAFVYENDKLSYTNIQGGRIINKKSSINNYQYYLTDHLGNVRVTFTKGTNGEAEIIQEDHYYPFGMRMSGQHYSNTELLNKYLYNGKEQQDQTNYYGYGFRQLDAQLGRWHVVDAMAESYFSISPYSYTNNDPINHIDILGLTPTRGYGPGLFDSYNARKIFEADGGGGASFDVWASGSGFGLGNTFGGRGLGSAGPSGADWDEWKAQGGKGNFIEWYKKRFDAAWKEGYTSTDAARAAGYTFGSRQVKKWRKKTELLTINVSGYDEGYEEPLKEVVIINEAYWETETYLKEKVAESDFSGWPTDYTIGLDNKETINLLNGKMTGASRAGYAIGSAGTAGAVISAVKKVPSVGYVATAFSSLFSTIFFLQGEITSNILDKYNNIDAPRRGIEVTIYTTSNSYVGPHQSAIFIDVATGIQLGWLPNY